MADRPVGARALRAGTHSAHAAGSTAGRIRSRAQRPIGPWGFAAVAVSSFGGPLALAALGAPTLLAGAADSAGLAMLVAAAGFAVALTIWLRYSEHITGAGGLFAFVEAAVGRRVALVQAAVWILSYVLYVIYTTVQIVYDLLPAVLPGERRYQTLLALLIPIAVAGVIIAGRTATLVVLGLIAAGQLALAGILDAVTVAHVPTQASSFGTAVPAGGLAKASAQTSLLYVCGSLPLFLGGELARPVRTIRRGLIGAFAVTALVILVAVAPLAAAPGLLRTAVPGVSVIQQFASPGLAEVIGIGVAVSIAGVILCEYLALTRLLHAIGGWPTRPIAIAIGAVIVAAAPFSLINPDGFYNALVKPSLIALWLSQLVVFLVFPRFARRHGQPALPAWTMSLFASGLAVYGLWTTLQQAAS
jgi:amino acid transporter